MTKVLKKKLKRIVLALVVACATTMSVLAFTKVNTGLFVMPKNKNAEIGAPEIEKDISNIGELMAVMPLAEEANTETKETVSSNTAFTRIPNTATTTYIYDAKDLGDFRDSVNSGNDYAGKTVYLMRDIDLSTVCSSTLGSWTPIGTFQGTFNGNYHTIKNLYISTASYRYLGFFSVAGANSEIRNTILENVYIYNSENVGNTHTTVGGFAGYSSGKIINCGVESGGIYCTKTSSNTSGNWRVVAPGGIAGQTGGYVEINSCYNRANVQGRNLTSGLNSVYIGGIVGWNSTYGKIINCYNTGSIWGQAQHISLAGIVGDQLGLTSSGGMWNCYNIGSTGAGSYSIFFHAGQVGRGSTRVPQNSYSLVSNNASCYTANSMGNYTYTGRVSSATELKKYVVALNNGASYKNGYDYDAYNINSGWPVLKWQNDKPKMEFTEKQAYIKTGENLKLEIVQEDTITNLLGGNYAPENFTWTSTNEDVASVDNQGIVTGKSDRIYYGLCKK